MIRPWAAGLLGYIGVVSSIAQAASFDCRKAVSADERAVCGDQQLSDLDTLVGQAFSAAKRSASGDREFDAKVMAIAHPFLAHRRICGTTRSCLIGSYAGALAGYRGQGSPIAIPSWVTATVIANGQAPESTTLPTAEGQCTTTTVTQVAPRLDGYDSGTVVQFANKGTEISYDREEAVIASRPGDKVTMCLLSIPHLCPPGDDRGRGYLVTNMRTHQTWQMGDSQHMCGGA